MYDTINNMKKNENDIYHDMTTMVYGHKAR